MKTQRSLEIRGSVPVVGLHSQQQGRQHRDCLLSGGRGDEEEGRREERGREEAGGRRMEDRGERMEERGLAYTNKFFFGQNKYGTGFFSP